LVANEEALSLARQVPGIQNVIKYLLMGTSSNFGNMFSMAGAFSWQA